MKSTPYFISNPKKGDDGLVFLSSELGEVVTSLFPFSLFVCVCFWIVLVVRYLSIVKLIKSQIPVCIPQADPDNSDLFLKSGENLLCNHLL